MGLSEDSLQLVTVAALVMVALAGHVAGRPFSGDACDWQGSGLHQGEQSRDIQPVYLRCAQGSVAWQYPRGALRVVLRPGNGAREFRGCIRVSATSSGAVVYVEGHQRLHPLYKKGDGRPADLVRCFSSTQGQAALYIEAEPVRDSLRRDVLKFSYNLQTLDPVGDQAECRPCAPEELVRIYCTSDFVIQGTVSALQHNTNLERTEITIRTSKVMRDSTPSVVRDVQPDYNDPSTKYVVVHRPLRCGTKSGSGEFLFMGTWSLGDPVVRCVPRLTNWKRARRKALMNGTNECKMD